ncbi:tape-measure protein [Streptomyces roseicoloratus]|uniref:Tape-measure protein n=1 Tax=Streptomyces roseicoloratus TaxID=2508722 RepID=A0ABY9RUA0_9ACTN|nr:tape-measure protein [Streptomyces roseicoloratus]WMX45545.1 tape-measure protein [Streptomyces roseicoloratus]
MSAAAVPLRRVRLPAFRALTPHVSSLRQGAGQAGDSLRRLRQNAQQAAGNTGRLAGELRTAATSVRTLGTTASGTANSVRGIQRSKAGAGVRKLGTAAGKARTAAAKFGPAIGGVLSILAPLIPVTDVITKLMGTYGTVMTVASVAMTGVNVAMRANPIGFLVGILVPVAAWLIEYAMQTKTGQKIMKQVFQAALKGFQAVWTFLRPVITLIGKAVGTYVKGYLALFKAALKGIGAAIDGIRRIGSAVGSASQALRGIASRALGGIKNAVKPVLTFVTDKIPGFFRNAKDAVGKALRGMGELVKGALTAVIGVVKGPINGLIAFANRIIDGLGKLSVNILGKKFGVDIDKIPMLAEGGVVFPGADAAPRIDPLTVLENRRVPAVAEAPREPYRIREFREDPGAGPRSTAEDLLFLATAHC